MSKIFECKMIREITFYLKAEDEVAAQDFLDSHSQEEVMKATSGYGVEYDDSVIGEAEDPDAGNYCIDIVGGY